LTESSGNYVTVDNLIFKARHDALPMTSRRERVVGTTRPDASTITERSLASSLWAQNVFRKPVF